MAQPHHLQIAAALGRVYLLGAGPVAGAMVAGADGPTLPAGAPGLPPSVKATRICS